MKLFYYYYIFFIQNIFTFFVSLYKVLSEFLPAPLTSEIFSACLIVLDNLREVVGCSILTDLGFQKILVVG